MTTPTPIEQRRISTKRLRAEITRVNNARKFGIGVPPWPGEFPGYNGVTDEQRASWFEACRTYDEVARTITPERATKLYSLRSHLRGRLHITHQYVQQQGPGGVCKEVCVARTMEDQAKLVEPLMAEFRMTDAEDVLDQELRAKRIALYGSCNAGPTPQDPVQEPVYGGEGCG